MTHKNAKLNLDADERVIDEVIQSQSPFSEVYMHSDNDNGRKLTPRLICHKQRTNKW